MDTQGLITRLQTAKEYFNRSTRCLTEEDSNFAPVEGLMTAAQQVAHVAQTFDWFVDGAFRPEGFNMDFAGLAQETAQVTSLAAARQWLDRAVAHAAEVIGSKSAEDLTHPLPEGIMGGMPRLAIVGAIEDHTAHHRGALTVYSRLRGHVPPMPYGDM